MKSLNKEFLIWLTGFFEGEGCIYINKKKIFIVSLSLAQSKRNNGLAIMNLIKEKCGVGYISKKIDRSKKANPIWEWRLTKSRDVVQILELMLPYTKIRTQHFKEKIQEIKKHFVKTCKFCGKEIWGGIRRVACDSQVCQVLNRREKVLIWQKNNKDIHRKHARISAKKGYNEEKAKKLLDRVIN